MFTVTGVNVNGIRGKWTTFKNIITKINPLVWKIQETKCLKEGGLKIKGFRVFEHIRSSQNGGGGLSMGCSTKLSPVLTRHGGDEAKALTVNLRINKMNISCCTAYGPQNNDLLENKDNFWQYIDEEAKLAERDGKGFLLQGDLNAWLGSETIPNDPNEWTIQSHDSSHELANRPFLGEICRKTRGILKVNVISKITRDS